MLHVFSSVINTVNLIVVPLTGKKQQKKKKFFRGNKGLLWQKGEKLAKR